MTNHLPSLTLARRRVQRGAAWLDQYEPMWHKLIDLNTFDIQDECACVLAQVGDRVLNLDTSWHQPLVVTYGEVVETLLARDGEDAANDPSPYRRARMLGFDAESYCDAREIVYTVRPSDLQAAWVEEVERRRALDA